ncbi:MAG TPA: hypothetical protein VNW71_16720 [Thermoanaerobaculia bacterium]|nr:hypothetical protein [Thermoanaerobaculia bacterium]
MKAVSTLSLFLIVILGAAQAGATNQAPDCSAATADPALIWPPNGKMVPVFVTGVTDPDGDPVTVRITAIHQDEPLAGNDPDATGLGTAIATVRASRSGAGDGRAYRLKFQATDPAGLTCNGEVMVCVPHSKKSAACGDGGTTVESTSPRPRGAALVWSTYLGGSADELKLADIEVDASGHAWIAGTTASKDYTGILDHPEEHEIFILDAFASRLDPAGQLVHSMILGQPFQDEHIEGLAIGPSGAVSLTGWNDDFGDHDVIAAQIQADDLGGSFDHYIGEDNNEFAFAVTTDRLGNVYIAGTGSRFFPGFGGDFEGGHYVLKLAPNHDFVDIFPLEEAAGRPSAVAVDHAGNIYVTGVAQAGGPPDVRVAKLDPSGNLLWSITLGGSQAEGSTSVKVDSAGRAWVAGWTDSPDFPVRGGRPYAGGRDAFLVRLTPGGAIDVSTLFGGAGTDEAHDLALDAAGRPYLAGLTDSINFPLAGALPGSFGAGSDAFVASFDFFGPILALTFSTRLGGGSFDAAYGVAVNPEGSFLWVSGLTRSPDFPTLNPWQPALAGGADVFVTKIALGAPGKKPRK